MAVLSPEPGQRGHDAAIIFPAMVSLPKPVSEEIRVMDDSPKMLLGSRSQPASGLLLGPGFSAPGGALLQDLPHPHRALTAPPGLRGFEST